MGVIASCCNNEEIICNSKSCLTTLDPPVNNNDIKIKIKINIDNYKQAFKYICSKDFYNLLRDFPKNSIIKTLCEKLSNKDILKIINFSIKWILNLNTIKYSLETKKIINDIKINTKNSTENLINELIKINLGDKIEDLLIESLANWGILIQAIMYIIYSNNTKKKTYNLWAGKNIIEESNNYIFNGTYFLVQTKIKYLNKTFENLFTNK